MDSQLHRNGPIGSAAGMGEEGSDNPAAAGWKGAKQARQRRRLVWIGVDVHFIGRWKTTCQSDFVTLAANSGIFLRAGH